MAAASLPQPCGLFSRAGAGPRPPRRGGLGVWGASVPARAQRLILADSQHVPALTGLRWPRGWKFPMDFPSQGSEGWAQHPPNPAWGSAWAGGAVPPPHPTLPQPREGLTPSPREGLGVPKSLRGAAGRAGVAAPGAQRGLGVGAGGPGCPWQRGRPGYSCFPPSLCRGSGRSGSQYCFVMMPANSPLVGKGTEPAARWGQANPRCHPPSPGSHALLHPPTHPPSPPRSLPRSLPRTPAQPRLSGGGRRGWRGEIGSLSRSPVRPPARPPAPRCHALGCAAAAPGAHARVGGRAS